MIIMTREYLISLLEAWRKDLITAKQLHECIETFHGEVDIYLDEEGDKEKCEDESVCNEVLGNLEMMDMDYDWKDDIDAYIEFLKTPIGQFKEGAQKFYDYKKTINIEERIKKLWNIPPYK
jgi:hypothetical protein